ncbi:beta strand repeat-containing protein [Dongia sp.]|uniref:beta strand repeat-containing protein n=1 Tax=Dongia sp. TaxID=1977262 RepID=UPI00374FFE07
MAIINGTNDPETLTGTKDDDVITGGRGNDIALTGRGDDRFIWNPGDGSDIVNGQSGFDTLAFNGANIGEIMEIRAEGSHALLTRNVAAITMDTESVERMELRTLGGTDTIWIGDMTGTAVREVAIDLGGFAGGGDAAADTVVVNGSATNNNVHVTATGSEVSVTGLKTTVTLSNAEADDTLVVSGLDGNDTLDASGLPAAALKLVLDGGNGNDKITGGEGDDVLRGGEGNDTVTGGHGNDVAFLGGGDDKFTWNSGDGNDTIEGQDGVDTVRFNGADAAETIQIFANGGRLGLTDSLVSVTLDMNEVDKLDIRSGAGADNVVIGDLTGTGLGAVVVDLGSDSDADQLGISGTIGADAIQLATAGSNILVTGLAAEITVAHAGANDFLTINANQGDDIIDASQLAANRVQLTLNGGAGNDTITGSAGNDLINGGQGSDTVLMGAGNDRFVWNPGDGSDKVNGQAGFDTLAFNGANIAEQIGISANGTHVQFTRNVAAIAMDLEQMERIEFRALGGADVITIGNLTGTGVKQLALDLGGSTGGGDGAVDTVLADFSNAKDAIKLTQAADGLITIASAAETITIANAETSDVLVVRALDGNDTLDASALKDGVMALTLDGGAGNDLIFGGAGADTLLGGEGNDTVTWSIGGGKDVIDGGAGIDTLVLNGSSGDDQIQVFANVGGKLTVIGSDGATLDVSGMEQVKVMGGAGKDSILIGDLSTTAIDKVMVDLGAGSPGETVTVQNGVGEVMLIESKCNQILITNQNTFQTITIDNVDSSDVLNVISSFGNVPGQVIMASGLTTSLHFTGGNGADTIFSGSGDDVIDGNQGNDVALMGAGNDVFNWDPGDGSDSVDGQAGFDTLRFNGSNIGEEINILADGSHAELTRNVAAIDMHLNSMERIEFRALGGADNIHVHDLSGTAVKQVAIDLSAFTGDGDGALDTVTVDGSAGNDQMTIASANGVVTMTGLPAQVTVSHGELDDEIRVNGGEGNDVIDASGVQSGNPHMTLDGGAGNDAITGTKDGDLIFGGDGHDILKGGEGADTIDGGQGDDVITGGIGDDVMGGGDGADTFVVTGMLDGHDLIEGFSSEDRLDLTQLFDGLGIAAGDREGRVSLTNDGFGNVIVGVDADGNTANGFEHVVATLHTSSPITVGQEVVVNG